MGWELEVMSSRTRTCLITSLRSTDSHPPQTGPVFFLFQEAVRWAGETPIVDPSDL